VRWRRVCWSGKPRRRRKGRILMMTATMAKKLNNNSTKRRKRWWMQQIKVISRHSLNSSPKESKLSHLQRLKKL
jgi:hypothetical protein